MMKGFTLIELMIAVLIVGVITAVAYPAYQDSVRKTHRTDGKQALLSAAQKMERYYTESNTYAMGTTATAISSVFPTTSPNGYYTLSFTSQSASAYTLIAAPTTLGGQNNDACGTFTLTSTGTKGVTGSTLSATDCW